MSEYSSYSDQELRAEMQKYDEQAAKVRAKIQKLEKTLVSCKTIAGNIQMELFLRERKATGTDVKGNQVNTTQKDFWKGVVGKSGESKTTPKAKKDYLAEAKSMLADLDL